MGTGMLWGDLIPGDLVISTTKTHCLIIDVKSYCGHPFNRQNTLFGIYCFLNSTKKRLFRKPGIEIHPLWKVIREGEIIHGMHF